MAQNEENTNSGLHESMKKLIEEARIAKMENLGDTRTFEFDVMLSELVDAGSIDGLNDILESRLGDKGFSHIPADIDYRAVGLIPGDDTHEGIITILATYTPEYMGMDEEDIDSEDRILA